MCYDGCMNYEETWQLPKDPQCDVVSVAYEDHVYLYDAKRKRYVDCEGDIINWVAVLARATSGVRRYVKPVPDTYGEMIIIDAVNNRAKSVGKLPAAAHNHGEMYRTTHGDYIYPDNIVAWREIEV